MASTFFGLTIAGSGLSTYQASINTTANNISNVKTKGYSRQEAMLNAAEAIRVNAKYGMTGSGVETTAINQIRDMYYDIKYWNNNTKLGEYQTKYEYMQQIETAFKDDDTIKGFSSIFSDMYSALEDLETNPSDESYRNQFISYSASFANYFKETYQTLINMQEDCNMVIFAQVQKINEIAEEISLLNQQINVVELQSTKANELRDKRALLIDQLSEIVPVEVEESKAINTKYPDMDTGATNYIVKINGHVLVSNERFNKLEAVAREYKNNLMDADGLYDVYWDDSTSLNLASPVMSGQLKALYDVRDGNNKENFSGDIKEIVDDGTISKVTVSNPSMDSVEELNLPPEGKIRLGNKYFEYSEFAMNDDGTFTFTLNSKVENPAKYDGQHVSVGEAVGFMGVPYYMAQMNEFIRGFARNFNEVHSKGQDLNGEPAGNFFTGLHKVTGEDFNLDEGVSSWSDSYYSITAENFTVATELFEHPELMSTSSDASKGDEFKDILLELIQFEDQTKIYRGGTAKTFLETVLSDIAIDTNKVKNFTSNYTNISNVITNQRMSISGVDEDDEALALIQYQNAYNLSSRMVQCMSEIYKRLILETGV